MHRIIMGKLQSYRANIQWLAFANLPNKVIHLLTNVN